jgi:hypothetical protein
MGNPETYWYPICCAYVLGDVSIGGSCDSCSHSATSPLVVHAVSDKGLC